jgi:ubiquitin carboxyl-terminal hydrolase 25/28
LHAIIIHDGLANNGHYTSFTYDRKNKVWWKANDHKIKMVSEDIVMADALGLNTPYR